MRCSQRSASTGEACSFPCFGSVGLLLCKAAARVDLQGSSQVLLGTRL